VNSFPTQAVPGADTEAPRQKLRIQVSRTEGLHLRPAAQLVKLSKRFRALVCLRANGRTADWRSILDLLLLEAHCGTELEIEASGEDERPALEAIVGVFGNAPIPLDAA